MRLIDEISLKFLEAQTANLKIITETISRGHWCKNDDIFLLQQYLYAFQSVVKAEISSVCFASQSF